MSNKPYTIVPIRGGKVSVQPTPDGTGYKTRAGFLAENFGKWVHRHHGYVMSPARAQLFEELYAEGWQGACLGGLYAPESHNYGVTFPNLRSVAVYRKAMVKHESRG